MFIPQDPRPLPAGEWPAVLRAACEVCEVEPGELLGWAVKNDEVQIILPAGQKIKFLVIGEWVNPPFPWMVDNSPPAYPAHMPKLGAFELPGDALPMVEQAPAVARKIKRK